MEQSTIAAVATPPGTGGIGVVRISGKDALTVAEKIFRPYGGKTLSSQDGYTALLGRVVDGEGPVDEAIALVFRAPRSYTGEDVVELSCHGSSHILQVVLRLCLDNGAELAGPGEFTKRAFLNGKLNLSQAEAVMDLIHSQGIAAMKMALSARDGALSTEIKAIVETLLAQSAHLAAWADYPDEEIQDLDGEELLHTLVQIHDRIEGLLGTYDRGKILREGIPTAIVGRPNVGKSTLMNLLSGQERSIVTHVPGTTRDVVEDSVRLGDLVLHLSDTAGIRDTEDLVEKIGVERAKALLDTAQLILAVFDSSQPLSEEDLELLTLLQDKRCIGIINKIDLPQRLDLERIRSSLGNTVALSSSTGEGREELQAVIRDLLRLNRFDPTAAVVANERQRQCLLLSRDTLAGGISALKGGMTLDAVNVEIDYALDALLSLTGERVSEKVIEEVFSRFCVGK